LSEDLAHTTTAGGAAGTVGVIPVIGSSGRLG
jgi:hypothetical protein